MATPALAEPDDLAVWLGLGAGAFAGAELARATAYLQAASSTVRSFAGKTWLDTTVDPPVLDAADPVPDDVASVTVRVAARAWSNPNGIRQETTGPFSVTRDTATPQFGLTDEEKDLLSAYQKVSTQTGLWTLGLTRGDNDLEGLEWVDHSLGSDMLFWDMSDPYA